MAHECIEIKPEVDALNKAIDKIEKLVDTWDLRYYHSRLQERHDISISNRDYEIYILKERIKELEKYEPKDVSSGKINIKLIFNKTGINGKIKMVTLFSNSKKYSPMYDEVGRKWFIPELKDSSCIKIKFIGKNVCGNILSGISESSAIIGNTTFSKGIIEDGFILNRKSLGLLLISPMVFFYPLKGTENIEILESSEDIIATLEVI